MSATFPAPIAGRGNIVVLATDCAYLPALGATLSATDLDSSTVPFYFANNTLSQKATATDGQGIGGWENVPVNKSLTITGSTASLNGAKFGSIVVNARPDAITMMGLQPTP